MPASDNSRPIPFALREQVREQIQIMLKDDILEESFSSYIIPLTLVVREAKPLRICVYARKINWQMTTDHKKSINFARINSEISRRKLHHQLGHKQRISSSST
jgi:hypothetical protein